MYISIQFLQLNIGIEYIRNMSLRQNLYNCLNTKRMQKIYQEGGQNESFSSQNNDKQDSNSNQNKYNSHHYACMKCQKKYSVRTAYENHLRMHRLPYSCNYENCQKKFSLQSALVRHTIVHTGEKPFECDYEQCDQKFNQKSNLNRHKRIHKNEKPFICGKCCKKFTTTTNLKQHIQIHSDKNEQRKVFSCQIGGCDKKYLYKCNLKKHVEGQHNDPMGDCIGQKIPTNHSFSLEIGLCQIKLTLQKGPKCSQSLISFKNSPNAILYDPQSQQFKNDCDKIIKQCLDKVNGAISTTIEIPQQAVASSIFIKNVIECIGLNSLKIIYISVSKYQNFADGVLYLLENLAPNK